MTNQELIETIETCTETMESGESSTSARHKAMRTLDDLCRHQAEEVASVFPELNRTSQLNIDAARAFVRATS